MKRNAILAAAIAGTFAGTVAFAGGTHYSVEVQTPASVNESAPWLAGQPHSGSVTLRSDPDSKRTIESRQTDSSLATGASLGRGAESVGTFDSSLNASDMNVTAPLPGDRMD